MDAASRPSQTTGRLSTRRPERFRARVPFRVPSRRQNRQRNVSDGKRRANGLPVKWRRRQELAIRGGSPKRAENAKARIPLSPPVSFGVFPSFFADSHKSTILPPPRDVHGRVRGKKSRRCLMESPSDIAECHSAISSGEATTRVSVRSITGGTVNLYLVGWSPVATMFRRTQSLLRFEC